MRAFNYITVGKILSDLKKDGLNLGRATFYRLEKKLRFPFKEKSGGAWRVYTPSEANQIKSIIKKNYKTENLSFNIEDSCDSLDYLAKLYELKNKGIVTSKEFDQKKKQLLGI